jgi:hypothetical protein
MWLPVAMLVLGLLVGLVAGGSWRAVRAARVRMWPIGVLGVAFTVLPWIGDSHLTTALVAIGWALLIAFALFNLHLTGISIVAIGLACNLAALLVNQAMPVRAESVVRAGIADESSVSTADLGPGRRLAEPGDRLEPLTAIVPLSALGMVVTFGDLIALAGLMDVGFRLARRRSPRHSVVRRRAPMHAARSSKASKRETVPLPAWATQKASTEGIDDWVLDLRETMRADDSAPVLASLAPDDDDDDPAPELEVRYSGQPLPSRH